MQDFRGIKPIGKIEEVSTPARGETRRITKKKASMPPCLMPTSQACRGRISELKETDDFTAVTRHVIFDENVETEWMAWISLRQILLCVAFGHFVIWIKSNPQKNNCVFKVTDEFYDCLLATIESSDSPLKEGLIGKAKLFYAPHNTAPYEVAHPGNPSFKHPEVAELSRALYDFVCRAAETTGRRVC